MYNRLIYGKYSYLSIYLRTSGAIYTLFNIFRNFIPNETIKCNHKDPPWMNNEIKCALLRKNRLYKKYISGGKKHEDEIKLRQDTELVSNLITSTKKIVTLQILLKS